MFIRLVVVNVVFMHCRNENEVLLSERDSVHNLHLGKTTVRFRVWRRVQRYGGYDLFAWISRLLPEQRQLYVRHHR